MRSLEESKKIIDRFTKNGGYSGIFITMFQTVALRNLLVQKGILSYDEIQDQVATMCLEAK